MATLYIIATPIGNLEDISRRALRILSGVDLILCEDTRVTKKLLDRYQIKTPTLSYHQHSKLNKINYILELLSRGKNLALVSDAGTPGISDPGNQLVKTVIESLSEQVGIIPIPGPSAVSAAASVSGLPMDKFLFLGFPPAKRKRKKFFEEIINSKYPVIFYESPYRIIKSLRDLHRFTQTGTQVNTDINIVVCRELTKKFETIYRGNIEEIIEEISKGETRGEFVVIARREKWTE